MAAKKHISFAIGDIMEGYAGEQKLACISFARHKKKTVLNLIGNHMNIARAIAHCMMDDPQAMKIIQDAYLFYHMDRKRREVMN